MHRAQMIRELLDPGQGAVQRVGAPSHRQATDAVRQRVGAMTGACWLEVGLGEVPQRQSYGRRPPADRGSGVVVPTSVAIGRAPHVAAG